MSYEEEKEALFNEYWAEYYRIEQEEATADWPRGGLDSPFDIPRRKAYLELRTKLIDLKRKYNLD